METCFVIQPFDNGDYDARYEQIYEPAIKEAAFRPYRVDRDPAASIPIENIERGIKDSTICFADVSEDSDEREGYEYEAVSLMPGGWDWVEENLAKFVLKRPQV